MTTSKFTDEARKAAKDFDISLVDGDALVDLMAKHSIGVRPLGSFTMYEVDPTWSEESDAD